MSEVFRREVTRSKPEDGSGGDGRASFEPLTNSPTGADAAYRHKFLLEVRAALGSMDARNDARHMFGKYAELAERCLQDPAFPRNLFAMSAVAQALDSLVMPVLKRETEIVRDLRHKTKRRWEDQSALTPEEGALLLPEEREKIAEIRSRLRQKSWQNYLTFAQEMGASGDTMPQVIDNAFLAYMIAVRDFFPGAVSERLDRVDQIAQKMLDDDLPADEGLRSDLTQKFGDVIKGNHNATEIVGSEVGQARVAMWNQALRKYNTSFT